MTQVLCNANGWNMQRGDNSYELTRFPSEKKKKEKRKKKKALVSLLYALKKVSPSDGEKNARTN